MSHSPHLARRRRAVAARYEEFIAALIPTNLRALDSRARTGFGPAVRSAFPITLLQRGMQEGYTFDGLVRRCREKISERIAGLEWREAA